MSPRRPVVECGAAVEAPVQEQFGERLASLERRAADWETEFLAAMAGAWLPEYYRLYQV